MSLSFFQGIEKFLSVAIFVTSLLTICVLFYNIYIYIKTIEKKRGKGFDCFRLWEILKTS